MFDLYLSAKSLVGAVHRLDGHHVSVFYLRAGYSPDDYPTAHLGRIMKFIRSGGLGLVSFAFRQFGMKSPDLTDMMLPKEISPSTA